MIKVKMFFDGNSLDFQDKINGFLREISYAKTVKIHYSIGTLDNDILFTAMILYDE